MVWVTSDNRKFQHSPTVELCYKSKCFGEEVMLIVSQGFCQEVGNIAFHVYIFNIDNTIFDSIMDVVITLSSYIYLLCKKSLLSEDKVF